MKETLKQPFNSDRNGYINGHSSNNIGFIRWLWHPHRGLPYFVFSVLIMLVSLFLIFHYYLSNYNFSLDGTKLSNRDVIAGEVKKSDRYGDSHSQAEILLRIDELKNIKSSVNKELLLLEKRRQQLLTEIENYTVSIEDLKLQYKNYIIESDKITLKLNNLKIELEEMKRNNQPYLDVPLQLFSKIFSNKTINHDSEYNHISDGRNLLPCKMSNCFDYSRCSIFSKFPVYIFNTSNVSTDAMVKIINAAFKNKYVTEDPNKACLFVMFNDELIMDEKHVFADTNHLVINLEFKHESNYRALPESLRKAIFAQTSFSISMYRSGFDIILPCFECITSLENLQPLPMMVPVKRKYLMTFVGNVYAENDIMTGDNTIGIKDNDFAYDIDFKSHLSVLKIIDILNKMQTKSPADNFFFKYICNDTQYQSPTHKNSDFPLCDSQLDRLSVLEQSTFVLILTASYISGKSDYLVSTFEFQTRLIEALRSGALPVIIGVKNELLLPFEDLINWEGAVLWVPVPRITELHYLIRSIVDEDILKMRQQCRLIYETFFASSALVIESLFSSLRSRLQIPPLPIPDIPSESFFNDTFPIFEQMPSEPSEENLGPIEASLNSLTFQRNYTSMFSMLRLSHPFEKLYLFPFTPFQSPLSGDAHFMGSSYGFRPIGDGLGGSGKEFANALGGDYPREQFTIVILTYEREAVLINAVAQFKGLPHLNKVVIIWNSHKSLSANLRWPDIGVKIEAIKMSKNSLNNRFLPFDRIQTEAVLSIDDDVHLRHDEITFAFRVWRQSRDRIVGFPGRFVSFYKDSNKFYYNSNYTCEMSMVLTGAAFIHKFYLHVYSHLMPQVIRNKVDEFMNCEDIAMNFLVSHISRKPPIKVTSRWTFKCPNCPNTLYSKDSHFEERHQCINFFAKIYGYLPLLTTQYRADSILFKTRIPHDKQKCFKYI